MGHCPLRNRAMNDDHLKFKPLRPFLDTLLAFLRQSAGPLNRHSNGDLESLEVGMKHSRVAIAVAASLFFAGCSSQAQRTAGPDQLARITAGGYTREGCLLNLKLTAREKNVRLVPDDLQVESNWLMLIFPFLNQEGYRCSASFTERTKRPLSKDPLYPID
jgi:hypothetical protein